ncbi:MAG: hypothetical protein R2810_16305 [Flavobacteriales bacterium]|nr:hypothetical protein [Flavobacteriales bacterium]MCB0783511.1 hypothetical protein [Flavobacteriales bacterium]MCB0815035.1 hypothetical protein [Flavobacteriales bacterium]MCB0817150.1 hypothetical protein [Flavobacteriales bacterium]HOP43255.1 hypothetical protein [Flavobacteriales bacterium]
MEHYNVSYNDPEVERRIRQRCGPPIGLWRSIRSGGTGSPRLLLVDGPEDLLTRVYRQEDRRFCNLERRTSGWLFRCRCLLETLAIPLPDRELVGVQLVERAGRCTYHFILLNGERLSLSAAAEHRRAMVRLLQGIPVTTA